MPQSLGDLFDRVESAEGPTLVGASSSDVYCHADARGRRCSRHVGRRIFTVMAAADGLVGDIRELAWAPPTRKFLGGRSAS